MTKNRISITEAVDTVMDSMLTRRGYVIDKEIAREITNDIVQMLKGQCIEDAEQVQPETIPWCILSWSASGLASMAADVASHVRTDILRRNAAAALWLARSDAERSMENGRLILSRMYCRHRRFQRQLRGDMSST